MPKPKHLYFFLILLIVTFSPGVLYAQSYFQGNIVLNCTQSRDKLTLDCSYRQITPEPLLEITANAEDKNLKVEEQFAYPKQDSITAILFLIDTSDPARQYVIDKNIQHLKSLLESTNKQHRFGLASFDKTLRIESPIGSSISQVNDNAQKLKAIGKTTELYRNMLKAIEYMKTTDADRKSIFLFSDGLAEDKAYYHQDVANAARKAGVIIISLGYPRSVSQSVALQTLRRLSEETGGQFVEVDSNFNLPQGFLNQPYDSIDNGGQISVDLSPIIKNTTLSQFNVNLTIETDVGQTSVTIPIVVPSQFIKKPVTTVTMPATRTTTQQIKVPPVKVVTVKGAERDPVESWLWYGMSVALIILVILTISTFFLILNRQRKYRTATSGAPVFKPYAYLVVQDETKKRYSIIRTAWRIGRSKDNELTLRDSSVSRRHAEIHRDKGDIFTLVDLESLNGVYVNDEKIHKRKLHEGDIVEIGDVAMRFTLLSDEYQLEESTVMQDTRVPITH